MTRTPSVGDMRARHAAGWLAMGGKEGPEIDAEFDAFLAAHAAGPQTTPRRPRRTRPKCEACGHSIGSHNELGYCTTGAGTPRSCDCDSYDDGLRRQPDGTLARPSATGVTL